MPDADFLHSVHTRYESVNRRSLQWLLSRSEHSPWLDSKFHPLELRDYTEADGLRGPSHVYGWIQGRGLEALVQHARHFKSSEPELAERLLARSGILYHALYERYAHDGQAAFCYDEHGAPVCTAPACAGQRQQRDTRLRTYSDLFVVKGLIAASLHHDPDHLPQHLAELADVVAAIDEGRFVIDASGHVTQEQLAVQQQDFGPRMIALGAASLLHRLDLTEHDHFSRRFLQHILTQHIHAPSGLLSNAPGGVLLSPGHAVEMIGFYFEAWGGTIPRPEIQELADMLLRTLDLSFDGKGICLTVDVAAGARTSMLCPWWALPETIRATALALELTGDERFYQWWQKADHCFFDGFWLDEPPIAVQMTEHGLPVDRVPATPDLDPGYHTGLSLLTAVEVCERLAASLRHIPADVR